MAAPLAGSSESAGSRERDQLRAVNEQLVLSTFSAQQQQAIAERVQRQQTEFIAVVAHELRNPLAPLRSCVEVLHAAPDNLKLVKEAGAIMSRQIAHLTRMVDDLLEGVRVTDGTLVLQRQRVALAQVVHDAVEMTRPLAQAAGHTLEVNTCTDSVYVDGDPVRLTQVFTNLLTNACRYTRSAGAISISVAREGAEALVSVQDSGIGLVQADLDRIFDMFVRVVDDGPLQPGMGIGLALVRRLVQLHGGSVRAHSAGRDQGSTFFVRLPVAQ